ncbi:hypothetical protein A2331_01705 [Candidatus Falkowbacteria bacterium RIFOXYB2_FULL_34_18]|uniref:Radical SAM core domain-containing protein n=1 Tax=Candidatus Falkowbacteria bacterium RIFOXYD2_FULL_34_120 TaxID=1798007 RepID=A0A1F5TQY7_9BACT|nr:MAG: hypothetical protein A2331_01705 [Candidatus Falkowbacteria bacterium RIFOXYB2_FULL_34_18]OGF29327.1 MAG: hypothetical protein A2500_05585 [Candidatus Falkowbacteria bacterium RIFOXYC12_FULL_34_55]OGF36443.1 MAG: hypothetical protein A2466_01245 [Candidatus Falkowbacteria bacterium RIFOXYC2_FULL_34_220]OGF38922.1 MAG: hypothetical protein A2515_06005 [Candidatus Falkowbacteria bacterium RIFOXYD12_FULL_34_57]OGF40941.1 MAG: hypothetical protein A2531_04230 [Candidatus Falkowbacteria bact
MKILLLNPPAQSLYLRDMYSSTKSKWGYSWPPTDILLLSGILCREHEIQLLDANILKLSPEEALLKIDKDINVVVFMIGSSSLYSDIEFIRKLKEKIPNIKAIGTGGCLLHKPEFFLERFVEIDAVLLNFVTNSILDYLNNKSDIKNLVYRKDNKIINGGNYFPKNNFIVPIPRHELLPINKYILPHGKRNPITSVLTSFGCPYKCSYCVVQNIEYLARNIENVLEELRYIEKLGIKEIIFRDNTFGVNKERTKELCRKIIQEKIDISWVCDSRVDVLNDKELLLLMKKSGCHTIHFGLESGDDEILKKYNKGITQEDMKKTFALCRDVGIKTMGYFIIGLPGENKESIIKTILLAKNLDCDYASFNIPIPIYGTKLREEAIKNKWINDNVDVFDGSFFPVIETEDLTTRDVWSLRNLAIRRFYLRPRFIFKKLVGIRSMSDLLFLLKNFKLLYSK